MNGQPADRDNILADKLEWPAGRHQSMYNLNPMESPPMRQRFAWITDGKLQGPDPACDAALRVCPEALAIPTVGAIVPNWALVVPRFPALSLAMLSGPRRKAVVDLAEAAAKTMGSLEDAVFFEHGPRVRDSAIGCGVDQAHLHVIVSEVDFVESALKDDTVTWTLVRSADPWDSVKGLEYYLLRAPVGTFIGIPRIQTSQFFRRHIARAAGLPDQWDYNRWPHYKNVRRTYERFSEPIRAAA
jgi:diadenosine tetraphosphate (Ap4A) HIT family hydrolase